MKTTEKGRLEVAAIEEKLDDLRRLVEKCEVVTGVSFEIDFRGYDQRINVCPDYGVANYRN